MARQDSTYRSKAGRHRWHFVSDARHRICVVRSGCGDHGREDADRPVPATPWQDNVISPGFGLIGNAVVAVVPRCEAASAPQIRTNCPDCQGELAVLRVIPGRTTEYWTLQCDDCGGIHLDIVDKPRA